MNPERVFHLLEELGSDCQEVVDTLADLGIKGKRDNAGGCPIANYLRREGVPDPSVNLEHLDWGEEECLALPEACAHFVVRFDVGEFPELLEAT